MILRAIAKALTSSEESNPGAAESGRAEGER